MSLGVYSATYSLQVMCHSLLHLDLRLPVAWVYVVKLAHPAGPRIFLVLCIEPLVEV